MILTIRSMLDYSLAAPSSAILQIEAAALPDQQILESDLQLSPHSHFARVPADEGVGQRVMLEISGQLRADYSARVEISRPEPDLASLPATPVHLLPAEAVRYLMGSRYCPSDRFQTYVAAEFSTTVGGARVAALRDWIASHLAYVPGTSDTGTTALETFVQRQGVCRDFAHLMIALARASGIPARIASVYSPDADPPDFHAVADVFLDGAWHLVDPTGMSTPGRMARIGIGRDAADISFLTLYGSAAMTAQTVSVTVEP